MLVLLVRKHGPIKLWGMMVKRRACAKQIRKFCWALSACRLAGEERCWVTGQVSKHHCRDCFRGSLFPFPASLNAVLGTAEDGLIKASRIPGIAGDLLGMAAAPLRAIKRDILAHLPTSPSSTKTKCASATASRTSFSPGRSGRNPASLKRSSASTTRRTSSSPSTASTSPSPTAQTCRPTSRGRTRTKILRSPDSSACRS